MLCLACTNIFNGTDERWYNITVKGRNATIPAYVHHLSPSQLKYAAADGCYICSIIWKKLSPEEQRVLSCTWSNQYLHRASQALLSLFKSSIAHYSWSPVFYSSNNEVGVRFQFGNYPFWKRITFRMQPDHKKDDGKSENPAESNQISTQSSSLTSISSFESRLQDDEFSMWSPRVRNLIQSWYDECTQTHTECRVASDRTQDFHPNRILDIRNGQVQLDVSKEFRIRQRYATLSHRWNAEPEQMPILTSDNLNLFCKGIDDTTLTQSFRDAIKVCRLLDVNFLWIDSLCILQSGPDSEQDWQRESAVMGEIYQNAYLNIQAGRDYQDSPLGLFVTSKARSIAPYEITSTRHFSWPDSSKWKGCHKVDFAGHFSIVDEDFARDELLGAAINQRGWVLQEHLLSHRILHFGAQQVFWECYQKLACETFPRGLPQTIPNTLATVRTEILGTNEELSSSRRQLTGQSSSSNFPTLTVRPGFLAWWYVVELYSTCSLTRSSDKLVAISGLAKIFGDSNEEDRASDILRYLLSLIIPRSRSSRRQKSLSSPQELTNLGEEYLAGLWGLELIPCLLWHVIDGRQSNGFPARRIEGLRAPSWSWASVDGVIHASVYQNWQSTYGIELVQILRKGTELVSASNKWGQVYDGNILLRGKVIHEKDISWPDQEEVKISAHTSEVHAAMVRKIKLNSASIASIRVLRADVLCYMDDMEEFLSKKRRSGVNFEIALLPLIGLQRTRETWSTPDGYVDEVYEYHGLVVALKNKTKTCTRLGYFRVQDTNVFGQILARDEDKDIELI